MPSSGPDSCLFRLREGDLVEVQVRPLPSTFDEALAALPGSTPGVWRVAPAPWWAFWR